MFVKSWAILTFSLQRSGSWFCTHFWRFEPKWKTFWDLATFAYCENHNRRHSCLLHKIPRENLYSSWRCYKNHKQQSDMCMIKRKPWQTRVFHQILHFFLFFSRHNMYLGTRYSLSQRGQNHYDVVYSPRVNMGDFNVKRLIACISAFKIDG